MDADEVREFARTNHRAVLGTLRADGAPQLSPVTVGVAADGRLVVSTRETAVKAKNLRRHPRAWLCLQNDGFYGAWAQAEGPVEIVALPEAMELLVAYYRDISGEHPDWADYRAAMERERRVAVLLTIERAGPNVSG